MDLDSRLRKRDRFKSDKSVDGTYDWTIDPKRIIYPIQIRLPQKSMSSRSELSGQVWTGDEQATSHGFFKGSGHRLKKSNCN